MAAKLYPPQIEGTLPAFCLQYDKSNSNILATTIKIPYSNNATVNEELISGFILRLRTASTGSYLFPPIISTTYNIQESVVSFVIPANYARLLNEGQYYKVQIAYKDSQDIPGYFSTVGIIKCTSKPSVYINNLNADNINFFVNEFTGIYDQTNCKDLTEKVYSYEFIVYDDDDNLYYTTGEKLHQSAYDTEYNFSIDKTTINDYVSNGKTYSIQYKVTTLNGLELSTPKYRLTNDNLVSPNENITIIPKPDQDNGYIDIHFEGTQDLNRSWYYILDETIPTIEKEQEADYTENNKHYKQDYYRRTLYQVIKETLQSVTEKLTYLKTHSLYKNIMDYNKFNLITKEYDKENDNDRSIWEQNKDNLICINYRALDNTAEYDDAYEYCIENNGIIEKADNIINQETLNEALLRPSGVYIQDGTRQIQTDETYNPNLQYWIQTKEYTKFNYCWRLDGTVDNDESYWLIGTGRQILKTISYQYVIDNGINLDKYLILIDAPYEAFYYGSYILSRASDEDNYTTWYNIARFKLDEEPPSSYTIRDITVEHGRKYKYGLQQYNIWGLISSRIMSEPVEASFEDMFLFDGERLLKVRFNPKVTSFKTTILEQKSDTIGGRFPVITRNGDTYYKEFPIGGLIAQEMDEKELFINRNLVVSHRHSTGAIEAQEHVNALRDYHMFSDENIFLERQFKLEVLKWLNDGKPKLFKSPYEGNYIVRLMQNTLTPVEELGRMLHSFTSQAYEIADCNYENLIAYGFLDVKMPSSYVGLWKTYNIPEEPKLPNGMIEIDFQAGLENFVIQDMMPGDIVHLYYADEAEPQDIMIGITGSYTYTGSDKNIVKMLIEPMSPIDQTSDRNTTGVVHCYYHGLRITAFDAIVNQQLHTIVGQQYIGVNPVLYEAKNKPWEIGGTISFTLSEAEYKELQNYNFRDYLDEVVSQTQGTKNINYKITDKFIKYIHGFDPGELLERINLTIGNGRAYKTQLLNIEQMKFTLRDVIPVFCVEEAFDPNVPAHGTKFNGNAVVKGYVNAKPSSVIQYVATSPYGYPHRIEELVEAEMLDPFCIFQVFHLQNGQWVPVNIANSSYYDPYYRRWLYDYDPTFKINYNWIPIEYKKYEKIESDDIRFQDSEDWYYFDNESDEKGYIHITKEQEPMFNLYKSNNNLYKLIRDYVSGKTVLSNNKEGYIVYQDDNGKYFYEKSKNYRIYLNTNNEYNFFDKLNDDNYLAADNKYPVENNIYYIKDYDTIISLATEKEKSFKNFDNINSIHIGSGVTAELTAQIKVIDYYTEIRNADVAQAKQEYLDAKRLLHSLASDYSTLSEADYYRQKYGALTKAYTYLLEGTNGKFLTNDEKEIIKNLLQNEFEKKDLSLLTLYEVTQLNSELLNESQYSKLLNIKDNVGLFEIVDNIENATFKENTYYYLENDMYFTINNEAMFNVKKQQNNLYLLLNIYFLSYTDEDNNTIYYVTNDLKETSYYKFAFVGNSNNTGQYIQNKYYIYDPSNTPMFKLSDTLQPSSQVNYYERIDYSLDDDTHYVIYGKNINDATSDEIYYRVNQVELFNEFKLKYPNTVFFSDNYRIDYHQDYSINNIDDSVKTNNQIITEGNQILPLTKTDINIFKTSTMLLTDEEVEDIKKQENFISIQKIEYDVENEIAATFFEEEILKQLAKEDNTEIEGLNGKKESLEKAIAEFNNKIEEGNEELNSTINDYINGLNAIKTAVNNYNNKVYANWAYKEYVRLIEAGETPIQINNFFKGITEYIDSSLLEQRLKIEKYPTAIERLYYNCLDLLPNIERYEQIIKDRTNDDSLDNYLETQIKANRGTMILNILAIRKALIEFWALINTNNQENNFLEEYKNKYLQSIERYYEIYQEVINLEQQGYFKTEYANVITYPNNDNNSSQTTYIYDLIDNFNRQFSEHKNQRGTGDETTGYVNPNELASISNLYDDINFILNQENWDIKSNNENLNSVTIDDNTYIIYPIYYNEENSNKSKYKLDEYSQISNIDPIDKFNTEIREFSDGQLKLFNDLKAVNTYFYRRNIMRTVFPGSIENKPNESKYTTFIFNPLGEKTSGDSINIIDPEIQGMKNSNNEQKYKNNKEYYNELTDKQKEDVLSVNKKLIEQMQKIEADFTINNQLRSSEHIKQKLQEQYSEEENKKGTYATSQLEIEYQELKDSQVIKDFNNLLRTIQSTLNQSLNSNTQAPMIDFKNDENEMPKYYLQDDTEQNISGSTEEQDTNIQKVRKFARLCLFKDNLFNKPQGISDENTTNGTENLSDLIGEGTFKDYIELYTKDNLELSVELLEQAIALHDLYVKQHQNYISKLEEYNSIYSSYKTVWESYKGTDIYEYYINNDIISMDDYRQQVREAWWKFLSLLDYRYTEEVERGMYI